MSLKGKPFVDFLCYGRTEKEAVCGGLESQRVHIVARLSNYMTMSFGMSGL